MNEQLWADGVEERIREAMEQGEFDDLPGSGRPLDLGDDGPAWWAKRKMEEMRRHDALLEAAREIDAEIDRLWTLPDERTVMTRIDELNDRLKAINDELPEDDRVEPLDPSATVRIWHRMHRLRR